MAVVQAALVRGEGVNRRHQAVHDAEILMDDFDDRRQAVRRTGCVGNDVVNRRIIDRLVHAHDDRGRRILRRRGNDHLLRAILQMNFAVLHGIELAGRFDNNVHAEFPPGQVGRIAVAKDFDWLAVHHHEIAAGFDFMVQLPVDRVIFEEMRRRLRIGGAVDSDDLHLFVLQRRPQAHPADSSKAVDSDFRYHPSPSCI